MNYDLKFISRQVRTEDFQIGVTLINSPFNKAVGGLKIRFGAKDKV